MAGFVYCMAVAMKEMGERIGWGWLVRRGLDLKEVALRGKIK